MKRGTEIDRVVDFPWPIPGLVQTRAKPNTGIEIREEVHVS